jgi:hypothetical protein
MPGFGGFGVLVQQVRCAVRGDHLRLEGHAEVLHHRHRMLHHVPVALAAHDDADARFFFCCFGCLFHRRVPGANGR